MNVYHNTFHAPAILAEGFKDATDYYLTSQLWTLSLIHISEPTRPY